MAETGNAEPQTPISEGPSSPTTPTQKSSNASAKSITGDPIEQQDFANPTLSIIRNFSRSTSASSVATKEETPPPLPPRPALGLLSRPSTSHSTAAGRPQLLSKATTQLSVARTQAFATDAKDESPTSSGPKTRDVLGASLGAHNLSDADDGASIRSYAPTIEAAGYQESLLGEVMGQAEKSEQEKSLLRTLGHKFVDAEAQSMFPPDPYFEEAFRREFDEVDEMALDGSNEGQTHGMYLEVALADVVNRSRYAPVARKTEAFPHPLECRQAHLQPTWRRPAHHELHWCRTDHHILLPVHQRYIERIHSRRRTLCRHVQGPAESGSHHAFTRERLPAPVTARGTLHADPIHSHAS